MPSNFETFEVAEPTGVGWTWDLPGNLGNTAPFFVIQMQAYISVAYSGGESTDIYALVRAQAHDADPGAFTEYTLSLGTSDNIDLAVNPAGNTSVRLMIVVPNSIITGKDNGRLQVWFGTDASSTGPDLLIGEAWGIPFFGPKPSAWTDGLIEVA